MRKKVVVGCVAAMMASNACSDDSGPNSRLDAGAEPPDANAWGDADASDAASVNSSRGSTTSTSPTTSRSSADAGSTEYAPAFDASVTTAEPASASNSLQPTASTDGGTTSPADSEISSAPMTSNGQTQASASSAVTTSTPTTTLDWVDSSSPDATTDGTSSAAETSDAAYDAGTKNDDEEVRDAALESPDASNGTSVGSTDVTNAVNNSSADPLDAGGSAPELGAADASTFDGSVDEDGSVNHGGDADVHATADADADTSEPSVWLTSLQVVGGRYPLKPAFDQAIKRYSVVATSDSEVLTLTATSSASTPITINGQVLDSGNAITLDAVAPGSDITLTLSDGSSSNEYVIKYLPPSFPNLVVTESKPGASTNPLYTTINVPNSNFAVKLDNNGVPYHAVQSGSRLFDFKKHPNGLMSYALWLDPNNTGARQVLLDANYQEIDRLQAVGLVNTDFHEFSILPNGNLVFLSYEPATRNLSPFGGSSSGAVRDTVFQEVSPEGQVLFQWESWPNFDYGDSVYALTPTDYAHGNAVHVDTDGNWLVSFRGFSQILKIHRTSGEVLWRLGGRDSDFTFIDDPFEGPCGQHTPSRVANGNLLIFDNGRDCLPDVSNGRQGQTRIVEYALDEETMTAQLVWSYDRPGQEAVSQGSAQRLSNGNTLIGWGAGPSLLATEVAPNGDVVFEIEARPPTGTSNSYRVWRFAD